MAQKHQARWEKNKAIGGIVSGRSHLATADKVFDRVRTIEAPHPKDQLPIYMTDNIPKDVFFPVDEQEIRDTLAKLPKDDVKGITHIWLRKAKASEFRNGRSPLAEYIAIDGVNLIAFYPWPEHLRMPLTKKLPDAILNRYRRWSPQMSSNKGKWLLEWQPDTAKDFCLSDLIRHEVAVHVEFTAKHAARSSRQPMIELPIQYANQRYIEENLEIW